MENKTNGKINANIFDGKMLDSSLYLIFYVIIPVIVTVFSLIEFPTETVPGIYCYVTILVSGLNGIYDASNRWRSQEKSRRNGKILAIGICDVVVVFYCFAVIISALIASSVNFRWDWILLVYIGTIVIVLNDALVSVSQYVAWKELIGGART